MKFKTLLLLSLMFVGCIQVKAQVKTDSTTAATKKFDGYSSEAEQRFHTDWPNLAKYKQEDKGIQDTVNIGDRVVFMGNSITELWKYIDPPFFNTHKNYINRGISGQTSPQMLLRFRQDVIDLHPKAVVILGGVNDIAGNTGPATLNEIFDNLVSMYELAKSNHIKVIIVSLLPAYDFPWKRGTMPAERIMALNKMLKAYAGTNRIPYVDFFSVMKDEKNGLQSKLTDDMVHPNKAGYALMEPIMMTAINKVIAGK